MTQPNTVSQGPITSYAMLQNYMNQMITHYGTSISSAPHAAFWNSMTYVQFIHGNVPNVTPAVQILKIGDASNSNIIQALRGVGPLFGPNGTYGLMPADGSGPWTDEDIQPLIDWINAKCPNSP